MLENILGTILIDIGLLNLPAFEVGIQNKAKMTMNRTMTNTYSTVHYSPCALCSIRRRDEVSKLKDYTLS